MTFLVFVFQGGWLQCQSACCLPVAGSGWFRSSGHWGINQFF